MVRCLFCATYLFTITSCEEDADALTLPSAGNFLKPTSAPRFTDLGLSVMWANENINEDGFFAWGELNIKSSYGWDSYAYCVGMDFTRMKKYTIKDGKKELEREHDVAFVCWTPDTTLIKMDGKDVIQVFQWRMPNKSQMEELRSRCTWTWTKRNNTLGYEVKGPSGRTIFFPAYGQKLMGMDVLYEKRGCYWTRTLGSSDDSAEALVFDRDTIDNDLQHYKDEICVVPFHRAAGCCVRPIAVRIK